MGLAGAFALDVERGGRAQRAARGLVRAGAVGVALRAALVRARARAVAVRAVRVRGCCRFTTLQLQDARCNHRSAFASSCSRNLTSLTIQDPAQDSPWSVVYLLSTCLTS
eukprot:6205048-Pleurochrysis_carterae.AAC.5